MPELPEVETTLRGITPSLEGQVIGEIVVRKVLPDRLAERPVLATEQLALFGFAEREQDLVLLERLEDGGELVRVDISEVVCDCRILLMVRDCVGDYLVNSVPATEPIIKRRDFLGLQRSLDGECRGDDNASERA